MFFLYKKYLLSGVVFTISVLVCTEFLSATRVGAQRESVQEGKSSEVRTNLLPAQGNNVSAHDLSAVHTTFFPETENTLGAKGLSTAPRTIFDAQGRNVSTKEVRSTLFPPKENTLGAKGLSAARSTIFDVQENNMRAKGSPEVPGSLFLVKPMASKASSLTTQPFSDSVAPRLTTSLASQLTLALAAVEGAPSGDSLKVSIEGVGGSLSGTTDSLKQKAAALDTTLGGTGTVSDRLNILSVVLDSTNSNDINVKGATLFTEIGGPNASMAQNIAATKGILGYANANTYDSVVNVNGLLASNVLNESIAEKIIVLLSAIGWFGTLPPATLLAALEDQSALLDDNTGTSNSLAHKINRTSLEIDVRTTPLRTRIIEMNTLLGGTGEMFARITQLQTDLGSTGDLITRLAAVNTLLDDGASNSAHDRATNLKGRVDGTATSVATGITAVETQIGSAGGGSLLDQANEIGTFLDDASSSSIHTKKTAIFSALGGTAASILGQIQEVDAVFDSTSGPLALKAAVVKNDVGGTTNTIFERITEVENKLGGTAADVYTRITDLETTLGFSGSLADRLNLVSGGLDGSTTDSIEVKGTAIYNNLGTSEPSIAASVTDVNNDVGSIGTTKARIGTLSTLLNDQTTDSAFDKTTAIVNLLGSDSTDGGTMDAENDLFGKLVAFAKKIDPAFDPTQNTLFQVWDNYTP